MPKYKFQFETGVIYNGSLELKVKDFVAEIEGKVTPALALVIEAHGGQLVKEKPRAKSKRKIKEVIK